jgi:hypothetical protein
MDGENTIKIWVIEYRDASLAARDCYPDFCFSQREAKRIAPIFMAQLAACSSGAWVRSWRIVEEEIGSDYGIIRRRHRNNTRRQRGRAEPSPGD